MINAQTLVDKLFDLESERKKVWEKDPTMVQIETIQEMTRLHYQAIVLCEILEKRGKDE